MLILPIQLLVSLSLAESPEPPPLKASVSVDGLWIAGNLNQLQLSGTGTLAYNTPHYGNDFIATGYRIWTRLPETTGLTRVGDDLLVTDLPFYYFTKRVYGIALLQYASSQLHQLDHRGVGGAAIGYAPVRRPEFLIRGALGAFYEYSDYPGTDFNMETTHDGTVRQVPRVGVMSNGWYREEGSAFSIRYIAWLFLNPMDTRDYRYSIDVSANVRIGGPVSLRLATNWSGSTVVMESVTPYDIRTTGGLTFTFPWKKE
jgi:hypothetical protein